MARQTRSVRGQTKPFWTRLIEAARDDDDPLVYGYFFQPLGLLHELDDLDHYGVREVGEGEPRGAEPDTDQAAAGMVNPGVWVHKGAAGALVGPLKLHGALV